MEWGRDSGRHIPALDGLRGLAILLVILYHHTLMRQETLFDRVYVNLARLGWSGVDLFFVLSGFLITGILYDSKGSPHYFRNFYVRRTLRIFPLYYAVVFFSLIVLPRAWPAWGLTQLDRSAMEDRSQAWYWLYLQNFLFARDENLGHPALAVSWSLAIEEQFYLVWPVVVSLLSRRHLIWTCGALILTALSLRIWMVSAGVHPTTIYVLPFNRMDALATTLARRSAPRTRHLVPGRSIGQPRCDGAPDAGGRILGARVAVRVAARARTRPSATRLRPARVHLAPAACVRQVQLRAVSLSRPGSADLS
jgi:peptidoglycan/LPS O-acetylase OafA/YrhL